MADGASPTRDLIFIGYSHADEPPWLTRLRIILKPYVRAGKLQEWSDPYIQVGDTWRREISTALARAKIGVCLVSPSFLASDFIMDEEVPPLLEAAKAGKTMIVAVPISAVDIDITPFEHLQWAHDPKTPLGLLGDDEQRNAALVRIVKTIAEIAGTARIDAGPTARPAAATPSEKPPAARKRKRRSIGKGVDAMAGGAVASLATGVITALSGGDISLITGLAGAGGVIAALALLQRKLFPEFRGVDDALAPPARRAELRGVPQYKPNFLPRDNDLARVRACLLAERSGAVGITGSRPEHGGMAVGLQGMGGIGKTELAVALAHDDDVRRSFPDGIHWLTLGQTPELLTLQGSLWRMAGGGEPTFADVDAGQRALATSSMRRRL